MQKVEGSSSLCDGVNTKPLAPICGVKSGDADGTKLTGDHPVAIDLWEGSRQEAPDVPVRIGSQTDIGSGAVHVIGVALMREERG